MNIKKLKPFTEKIEKLPTGSLKTPTFGMIGINIRKITNHMENTLKHMKWDTMLTPTKSMCIMKGRETILL